MSTPSNSTSLITPSRSGAQGFRSKMLWETVKFNFALVGLGSESLAKLFRDDSPILTIAEPPPTASVDQPIFDEGLLEEGVIESPIGGGDKLQELRNAFAGNLAEPPLISTITEPSRPTFLDEEPAEQTPVGTERTLVDQAEQRDAAIGGTPAEQAPVGTERALVDEAEQTDAAIGGTPAEQAPVDAPADEGNLAIRAERAKSVLAGLDLDTAIRLRWVLRDIRGKRTKLSPIGQNDLMALIELGLIEMQNDEPALTNEGMLAIAHSTGPTGPNEGERGE
jgi:hypothetical protein